LLVSCASSPNKELRSAQDDRSTHFTENVRAQHDLGERQHAEDAMLANKHAAERRDRRDTTMGMLITDNERVETARVAVVTDRHAFDAAIVGRMAKIDARADRLSEETNRSPAYLRAKVTPIWRAFDHSRASTRARINTLWTHSNDAFPAAKADVEAHADAMEGTLDAIANKIER
jgi:hypothetical protein